MVAVMAVQTASGWMGSVVAMQVVGKAEGKEPEVAGCQVATAVASGVVAVQTRSSLRRWDDTLQPLGPARDAKQSA
eukprot:170472-Pleurochrysis_carterae.AAC.1